jgi:hypothetical protein
VGKMKNPCRILAGELECRLTHIEEDDIEKGLE